MINICGEKCKSSWYSYSVNFHALTDHDHENKEKMYDEISVTIYSGGRSKRNAIEMGDYNSITGSGSTIKLVGTFGPDTRDKGCSSTSACNMIW